MVWDGDTSWEVFEDYFILTATGFDDDLERTGGLELPTRVPFLPSHYSMYVIVTAGATNLISVKLQGIESTEASFYDIATVVDSRGGAYVQSSTTDYTSATGKLSEHLFRRIRIYATTVGAGNTLTVTVIGRR